MPEPEPCDSAKRYNTLHCGDCGVSVAPRATADSAHPAEGPEPASAEFVPGSSDLTGGPMRAVLWGTRDEWAKEVVFDRGGACVDLMAPDGRTVGRQVYVERELADAAKFENRQPLDESGIWSLHTPRREDLRGRVGRR